MKSKKLKDKRNATNQPIRARLTEDLKLLKSTPSKTEPSKLFQRVTQAGTKDLEYWTVLQRGATKTLSCITAVRRVTLVGTKRSG